MVKKSCQRKGLSSTDGDVSRCEPEPLLMEVSVLVCFSYLQDLFSQSGIVSARRLASTRLFRTVCLLGLFADPTLSRVREKIREDHH